MKSAILAGVVILTLAIGVGFVLSRAKQIMGVKVHAKDLPQYGLIIVKGTDPDFERVVSALYRNATTEELDAIKALAVGIKNTGSKIVVAHTIIWDCTDATGKKKMYRIRYANSEFFTDRDDYEKTVSGMALDETIKPDSTRLVSFIPLRHGGAAPSGGGGGGRVASASAKPDQGDTDKNDSPDLSEFRARLLTEYTDITVSIDGVFFDDGSFVGPDMSGFFDRMKAQVEAKRALRNSIAEGIKENKSEEEIFKEMQAKADMDVKPATDEATVTDYYDYCTKLFAGQIVLQRKIYGHKVVEDALRLANSHQANLHRAEGSSTSRQ